ncbi:hypothetical protein EWB00_010125 [Schistosoma japonicum]|uniref:Uncharacterized protein n=1 Tax=Schistosoma japonicum TaxID=6182 RepID=A0A4Z2CL43_SCHJA|nr:hypothetical protein EWB00_010125 [Schistosoma japonicum]
MVIQYPLDEHLNNEKMTISSVPFWKSNSYWRIFRIVLPRMLKIYSGYFTNVYRSCQSLTMK